MVRQRRCGSIESVDPIEGVKTFLRAQNLEQLGRIDEAIELYESVALGGFDAIGPYDRLIALYSNRALHRDVIRVAELALANVHTHEQKRDWYQQISTAAATALSAVPRAAPKNRG